MASRSVNKAIIVGHLGKDAETTFTPGGVAVTKFSVATSRRWKDKQSDEWVEETDWINVVLWRNEGIGQYLTKGKQVYTEGRIQTRSWEKDGEKKYMTEIIASEVILLGGGAKNDDGESKPRNSAKRPAPSTDDSGDDEVPF